MKWLNRRLQSQNPNLYLFHIGICCCKLATCALKVNQLLSLIFNDSLVFVLNVFLGLFHGRMVVQELLDEP